MVFSDQILEKFSGSSPLFPLPDFVLFPLTGYTFRIFEERYIEMVEDVLQNEKLICVTQIDPQGISASLDEPKIHPMGTLAYIFDEKKLDNGEFVIRTFALKKVQINEAEKTHLYRIGALTILEDNTIINQEKKQRKELFRKFSALVDQSADELDISVFQNPLISIEMLVNMICQSLPIPWEEQQKLLELPDVALRLDVVCQFMDSELNAERNIEKFNQIIPIDPKWN
jgi:hypothetical protein